MYRPYFRDPPHNATQRYYQGFEWLMRELGGKPHWAKTFDVTPEQFSEWYGSDWADFRRVRATVDSLGMFVGPWHRRNLLGGDADGNEPLPLEELGFAIEPDSHDDGLVVTGLQTDPVSY
jgi:D-arabinono-1,4-lactone oxidase